jgi:hypothetical protein
MAVADADAIDVGALGRKCIAQLLVRPTAEGRRTNVPNARRGLLRFLTVSNVALSKNSVK